MFSLGSSYLIANIVAGYMLIYRRAFKLGDIIKVGEHFGEVVTTRLQACTAIAQERGDRDSELPDAEQ